MVKLIIGAAITITSAANSSSTSASDCASSARWRSVCGPVRRLGGGDEIVVDMRQRLAREVAQRDGRARIAAGSSSSTWAATRFEYEALPRELERDVQDVHGLVSSGFRSGVGSS